MAHTVTIARTITGIAALALALAARGDGAADRVVIVANSAAPDSVSIAEHYAQVRGVPRANIIARPMPLNETITWKEFSGTIWQPLEDELVRRHWIDAIAMDLFDEVGRRKYAVSGHRIAALVVCRGVPLRISNDGSLYREVKPLTDHGEFRTNQGAVDSELSLLAVPGYPINACVPNPLFGNPRPSELERAQVVEVSRLDGPTAQDARGLVDAAVEAERSGLLGRAYVDIAGPHENGDRWLERTGEEITGLGYEVSTSHGPGTLDGSARFDAPALYFGWYTGDLNGPFALPGFRFPPGAIAFHIHSFSAHTLRSATEGWCGPLVDRGAAATLGNVFEPYLEYTHRPDLFVEALAHGYDLVEAAYFALPVLSWQAIVIGDPLYRPFAVPLAGQTRNLPGLPPQLAGYAVIRRMIALDAAGRKTEAIAVGTAGMAQAPNLALGLALAERLEDAGSGDQAVWVLKAAAEGADTSTGNWGVLREAASFLADHGRSAEAIDVYRKLLDIEAIPGPVRAAWLSEARRVALASGDAGQAAEWQAEIGKQARKPADSRP